MIKCPICESLMSTKFEESWACDNKDCFLHGGFDEEAIEKLRQILHIFIDMFCHIDVHIKAKESKLQELLNIEEE